MGLQFLAIQGQAGCCSASLYPIANHQQIDTGSTFFSTSRLRNVSDTRLILSIQVGAYADVEKAKASRNIRRGKGKMRNRRYVGRKGPLVVFGEEDGISKAFRNLPGVEVSSVDSLNLLQVRNYIFRHISVPNMLGNDSQLALGMEGICVQQGSAVSSAAAGAAGGRAAGWRWHVGKAG